MRSRNAIPILLVVAAIAVGACGDDGTAPNTSPSSMQFLRQDDFGCAANRGGSLECDEGATLTRIEAVGDTVVLWIHFEANCCPEFTEDISYKAGELSIAVVDTLYACRCICPFENSFHFLRKGSGELHVLFESRAMRGGDVCVSGLDTTVVVP
jgi:hypothetical protein